MFACSSQNDYFTIITLIGWLSFYIYFSCVYTARIIKLPLQPQVATNSLYNIKFYE